MGCYKADGAWALAPGTKLRRKQEAFTASNACLPCCVWKRQGFLAELCDNKIKITSLLKFFTHLGVNAS